MNCSDSDNTTEFLNGGGDMGFIMRRHDWAATPLGAPDRWPQSLKTVIRILLTSRYPMWMAFLFTPGYSDNAIVHGGRLDECAHLLSKPLHTRGACQENPSGSWRSRRKPGQAAP